MFAAGVGANGQARVSRITGVVDENVTGIEVAIDVQGRQRHGHHQAPVELL
ncbi:hypothetical protein D3C77_693400 [compost metagenome]